MMDCYQVSQHVFGVKDEQTFPDNPDIKKIDKLNKSNLEINQLDSACKCS